MAEQIGTKLTQTQAFQRLIDLAMPVVRLMGISTLEEPLKGAAEELYTFLHNDCPKPKHTEVLVRVAGGMVTGVRSNHSDTAVDIQDYDNIEQGDEDPFEEHKNDSEDEYDWDAAGYPHGVW